MIKIILLASYLLTAMNNWMPETQHSYYEKKSETDARYQQIALDIAEVVLDPSQEPIFTGENGRVKTGLLLASIASFESGYNKRVMLCKRNGDHNRSFGLWQTQSNKKKTCSDVKTAAVIALEMIRRSMNACPNLPLKYQMSVYTNGRCCNSSYSNQRMSRALNWYKDNSYELVETDTTW